MKIKGKIWLTLLHTLTFLGSKNDTTAKYKEGVQKLFRDVFLVATAHPYFDKKIKSVS